MLRETSIATVLMVFGGVDTNQNLRICRFPSLCGFLYVCVNEFERIEHFNTSFSDTVHSNDNGSKRNKTILIYDGELTNKK